MLFRSGLRNRLREKVNSGDIVLWEHQGNKYKNENQLTGYDYTMEWAQDVFVWNISIQVNKENSPYKDKFFRIRFELHEDYINVANKRISEYVEDN